VIIVSPLANWGSALCVKLLGTAVATVRCWQNLLYIALTFPLIVQSHACAIIHEHSFSNYHAFDILLFFSFCQCNMLVQKEGWKLHQLECRAMAALTEDRKKMLTPTIRLMVRLVLKRKLQNEKVVSGFGLTPFLACLSSNYKWCLSCSPVVISFYSFSWKWDLHTSYNAYWTTEMLLYLPQRPS
jgi:hypothetical protein